MAVYVQCFVASTTAHSVSDALQAHQLPSSSRHSLRRVGVCCGRGTCLFAILGNGYVLPPPRRLACLVSIAVECATTRLSTCSLA